MLYSFSKMPLAIRLNLLDEEAKRDLDSMTISTAKKIKQNPPQHCGPSEFLGGKLSVEKENRRSRRIQKINYKTMTGD
jgi:hypothetical protein